MAARKKRSPVPAVTGNGASKDHAGQQIDLKFKQPRCKNQPVAIPRDFGFCHAVFIRVNGAERRAGLYADTGAAVDAAADLNEIFADGSS